MNRVALLVLLAACGKSAAPPAPRNEGGDEPLVLRVEATGGGHALVIENPTSAAVRFQREIRVSTEAGARVDASNLYLREECDAPGGGLFEPPACVEIAAGATFRAAPWTDDIGDAQCACEECGPVDPGGYKLGVTPCDGGESLWTEVFAVDVR